MEYSTSVEKSNIEENNVLYGTLDNGQRIKLIRKKASWISRSFILRCYFYYGK